MTKTKCAKTTRPEGRPPKREVVQEWRARHPDGRKIDCEKDTGLSRHTVLRWWDEAAPAGAARRPMTTREKAVYDRLVKDAKQLSFADIMS